MTYRVEVVASAAKELRRLPTEIRERCVEALGLLAQNPFSELLGVKKLKGTEDVFRIRVRDWRILYEVRRRTLVIVVIGIGHRRDVYR